MTEELWEFGSFSSSVSLQFTGLEPLQRLAVFAPVHKVVTVGKLADVAPRVKDGLSASHGSSGGKVMMSLLVLTTFWLLPSLPPTPSS